MATVNLPAPQFAEQGRAPPAAEGDVEHSRRLGPAYVDAPAGPDLRIARSLRSTVFSTQPSLAAISSLVKPSIFQRATARRVA